MKQMFCDKADIEERSTLDVIAEIQEQQLSCRILSMSVVQDMIR